MKKEKVKEILDYLTAICSIVSCIAAVYGVFQVVEFVVEIKPIVVPIAKEVREGNLDARMLFSGSASMVRHDTIKVYNRDTIYVGQSEPKQTERTLSATTTQPHSKTAKRMAEEEEQRLDHSADNVSEQERQKIEEKEFNFRQRMRDKLNQRRIKQE